MPVKLVLRSLHDIHSDSSAFIFLLDDIIVYYVPKSKIAIKDIIKSKSVVDYGIAYKSNRRFAFVSKIFNKIFFVLLEDKISPISTMFWDIIRDITPGNLSTRLIISNTVLDRCFRCTTRNANSTQGIFHVAYQFLVNRP